MIVFTLHDTASVIFDMAFDLGFRKRFIWVGGDAWAGFKIDSRVAEVVNMAIGVKPKIKVVEEFDQYFMK